MQRSRERTQCGQDRSSLWCTRCDALGHSTLIAAAGEKRSHTFITAVESRRRFVKIFVPQSDPVTRRLHVNRRAHPTTTSGSGEIEVSCSVCKWMKGHNSPVFFFFLFFLPCVAREVGGARGVRELPSPARAPCYSTRHSNLVAAIAPGCVTPRARLPQLPRLVAG